MRGSKDKDLWSPRAMIRGFKAIFGPPIQCPPSANLPNCHIFFLRFSTVGIHHKDWHLSKRDLPKVNCNQITEWFSYYFSSFLRLSVIMSHLGSKFISYLFVIVYKLFTVRWMVRYLTIHGPVNALSLWNLSAVYFVSPLSLIT